MKLLQIHEHLTGVKQFHNLSWEELKQALHQKGIYFIGGGSFGEVFTSSKWKYVVKIFEEDNAYLNFVNYVIKNPSTCFPKFKKQIIKIHQFHTRPSNAPKFLYAVRIERLRDVSNLPDELKGLLEYMSEDLIDVTRAGMLDFEFELLSGILTTQQIFDKYARFELEDVIKELVKYFDHCTELAPDLHTGNFMLRGNKLICIDPVFDPDIEGAKVIDMLGLFRAVRPEKSTTGYTYSKNISNVDISGPIYNTIQSI